MFELDGFKIDLNRITRKEYLDFVANLQGAAGDLYRRDQLTAELAERVIVTWPYGEEISAEAYFNLGLNDSGEVDAALTKALGLVGQKK
jgi:hypothetical protein